MEMEDGIEFVETGVMKRKMESAKTIVVLGLQFPWSPPLLNLRYN